MKLYDFKWICNEFVSIENNAEWRCLRWKIPEWNSTQETIASRLKNISTGEIFPMEVLRRENLMQIDNSIEHLGGGEWSSKGGCIHHPGD